MTDCEADMKLHVSKVHTDKLKSIIDSKLNVEENDWLDMTSFWSVKDIGNKSKMCPEVSYKDNVVSAKLQAFVIMDVPAKDPHRKTNSFP